MFSYFFTGQTLHSCENLQKENDGKFVKIIESEIQNLKDTQNQAFRNQHLKLANDMTTLKSELESKLNETKIGLIESQKESEKLQFEVKQLEAKIEKNLGTKLMKDLHKIETKLDNYLQAEDEKIKALEELVNSHESQAKRDSKRFSRDLESLRVKAFDEKNIELQMHKIGEECDKKIMNASKVNEKGLKILQSELESFVKTSEQKNYESLIKDVKCDLENHKMQNLQANKAELVRVEKSVEVTLESHISKIKDDMNSKDSQLDLKQTKQLNDVVTKFESNLQTLEAKLESNFHDKLDKQVKLEESNFNIFETKFQDLMTKNSKDLSRKFEKSSLEKFKTLEEKLKTKADESGLKELENKMNEKLSKDMKFDEMNKKIDFLQKSVPTQLTALKSEISDKQQSLEKQMQMKAEQNDVRNIELQMHKICEECDKKIANASKASNEGLKILQSELETSIKTLQQKNLESDHKEKISKIEAQLKLKVDEKNLTAIQNSVMASLQESERNMEKSSSVKFKTLEEQLKTKADESGLKELENKMNEKLNKETKFEEMNKKIENVKNSVPAQLTVLKNEMSDKHKSFEAQMQMKADRIDLQNIECKTKSTEDKIKILKSLEDQINKLGAKNEQYEKSLGNKLDSQLSKLLTLEAKVEKFGEVEKKQEKLDVKLESHRIQLQSLSSLEAKLESKSKDKYDQLEKKYSNKDKMDVKDVKSNLDNLQKSLEVKFETHQNDINLQIQDFQTKLQNLQNIESNFQTKLDKQMKSEETNFLHFEAKLENSITKSMQELERKFEKRRMLDSQKLKEIEDLQNAKLQCDTPNSTGKRHCMAEK